MNQNTTQKGRGYFRKSKAYGLVCGIALGAMLFMSNSVSADEVSPVETAPTAVLTDNPATNLQSAQPETPVANQEATAQSGNQTGTLTSEVTSEALNSAVESATQAGVEVNQTETVTHNTLTEAQADLNTQVETVNKAEVAHTTANEVIQEAVGKAVGETEATGTIKVTAAEAEAKSKEIAAKVEEVSKSNQAKLDEQAKAQAEIDKKNAEIKANNEARAEAIAKNKAIDEANAAEQARVDKLNAEGQAEVDKRNAEGQAAVDAKNKEAKDKIDAQNKALQDAYNAALARFNNGTSFSANVEARTQNVDNLEYGDSFMKATVDDRTGDFTLHYDVNDGVGVFGEGKINGRINWTVSSDGKAGEVIVVSTVTLKNHSFKNFTANRAVNQNISLHIQDLKGNNVYSHQYDGNSDFDIPINKTLDVNLRTTLAPNQTSSLIQVLNVDDNWIHNTHGQVFVQFRNTNQKPGDLKLIQSTPDTGSFEPDKYEPIKPNLTPKVDVPEERFVLPPAPSPELDKIGYEKLVVTTNVHDVLLDQKPSNDKDVINADQVSVDGQLVPKGSTVTWTLANDSLKAGREVVTAYTMSDPLPSGFEIDAKATAEASPAYLVTFDETGKASLVATEATLKAINADLTKDVAIPVATIVGRVVNDGATYKNTFTTTITTPKGEYTTVSDTPVVYTPGSEVRTYNGNVVVRYRSTDGLKIAENAIDVEDGKVGSSYDTTDNKPAIIAFEGNQYKLTEKVEGAENGKVIDGTIYVTYFYDLVAKEAGKGSVIVHYVEEGTNRPIAVDVVDTPSAPVGESYETTDNKPGTIKTNDGIEYELIPTATIGNETGKVVEGVTEVTYVYKRLTPKPETPTPTDNLIEPKKDVVDDKGNSIDGKSVLPNTTLNYLAKQDFDQYRGMLASRSAILKNFLHLEDLKDEALDGKSLVVNSITASNGDDVRELLEMRHVLSLDALEEKLQTLIKDSGISPVGEFYLWVAKDPQKFFEAYVQKGLDITYNLSFKIKETFKEGDITNQTFQIDFGNGYAGNVVVNNLPVLAIHKDVLDKDGKSIDGGTVQIGDEVTYKLEGWVIPADRGYDFHEYRFVDQLQATHDEYQAYRFEAKVDITLADGTVIKAGADLKDHVETVYDAKFGLFVARFKEDFLKSIQRESAFGADGYITVKRIKAGDVTNSYQLYVNGNPVVSNVVITHTPPKPTPPAPEAPTPEKPVTPTPVTPATPVVAAKVLPQTGDGGSIGLLMAGLVSAMSGLGFAVRKRKED
ncbi:SspB-related isopeptide-forming adhesin [Streptococcus ovuberis]|uniref:LPXTG cell wall anchor domain-containing protein n=1 Tax=Streptococcus ovuberis TaxID=1936207 RepID=A0A7X6MXF4_9STRE|nr:SspB-related isopeptide-forming adhesin [Streptococcus ovuberis]NKZ19701.1 LPXTG cell wall anchor domain-containing protein [Streptococcus ovuberis]